MYNLLINAPFSFCDLNGNKNNGKVDLKSNIKQGYKYSKGSSAWSITGNFFSGVWDGVKDTVVGTIAVVSHPVKTIKDLVKLATLSQKDLVEIGAKAGFAYSEKMINGTPDKRAHMAGKLVAEIALLVAGTKGVDKVAKAVKASKAAKAAKVLDNLEEGSSDFNKVNSVIGKADSTLEKTIKDTYKTGKVDMEVGEADEIIEGSRKIKGSWKKHLTEAEGFSKRNGVKGAHTQEAFEKYFAEQNIKYKITETTEHPTIDGIKNVAYQIQAKDYRGVPIEGQYNTSTYKKTIIDTSKISTETIDQWASEALKNGSKTTLPNNNVYFKGTANNGLKFEGWINSTTETFDSLYPVLEWSN